MYFLRIGKEVRMAPDAIVEYRGFLIYWQQQLGTAKWAANITSACPSLFPAGPVGVGPIDSLSQNDSLFSAMLRIDDTINRGSTVHEKEVA